MEIWKPIAGYEGRYEVSNHGRVRSLDRVIEQMGARGELVRVRYRGKILKPAVCTNLYLRVFLGAGQANCFLVHRLVAKAFVENPNNYPEINHRDGVRSNNVPDNLQWVTRSINITHAHRELPRKLHALTRAVKLVPPSGEPLIFDRQTAAAKYLGVAPGSVASAAARNHRCRWHQVLYV